MKRTLSTALVLLIMFSLMLGIGSIYSKENQFPRLAPKESEIVSRVNGTSAWNYDLELEKIALDHSNSNYAFRSSGSVGANETAQWIKEQFQNFGLETTLESFEFATWNLRNRPSLAIYDGDSSAESNQMIISSFQSTHYSWPTPEGGVLRDLVVLPLPENLSRSQVFAWRMPYNVTAWNALNTTGKILLIGYELRWNEIWHQAFWNKLKSQPPAAIIYTYWYSWMSSAPISFTSVGGLPLGDRGPYYWQLKIPVGWVSYEDGLWIRKREKSMNVSASLAIPAVVGTGPHYNVVGELKSSVNPGKYMVISSHYDTVMTSGFCDNGAGTAAVLELARVFANAAGDGLYHPEYTILFIAFAGEELSLAGSINYVKQHEAEMNNTVAVINLDSIGSDVLKVTETFPNDDGLDLDELVQRAAGDLGTKAELEEGAASDEDTFRNPKMATSFYEKAWGLDAGIAGVARVKASLTIMSFPLFYSDEWENKTRAIGWIHTQYDNSTSTATMNWVEFDDLKVQIQVAALSIMRVSSNGSSTLSQILIPTMVIIAVLGVVAYFKSSLVSGTLKNMYGSLVDYVEMRGLVIVIILTCLLLFASIISYSRAGRIEVIQQGIPTPVPMLYLGYPFEMIALDQTIRKIGGSEGSPLLEALGTSMVGTQVFWSGLVLDLLFYFLSALLLVYVVARLRKGG